MNGDCHTHEKDLSLTLCWKAASSAPGWAASPYTELVAGSDVNPAVFPAWQEKHGISRFFEEPWKLIEDPEIDMIDICSPNMECVEFARAVAEGLPSPVPAENSLYVQTILDGIYRSQAAGREVEVCV